MRWLQIFWCRILWVSPSHERREISADISSRQCYCGNVINTGSALVEGSQPSVTQCDMTCSGNPLEYCGGPDRLNMYQYETNGTATVSTTATGTAAVSPTATGTAAVSSTATHSSSATPTPTGPITVGNFAGWNYMGCYSESFVFIRS